MNGTHEEHMRRALQLAARGIGRTSPNPMVGAVVVREGNTVGEGFHLYDRIDHAEVIALDRAGKRAVGADLYLNLEPCCHQGRTPPCTERVMRSGVRRVFIATEDPNPLVSGKGVARLQKAGIEVLVGLLEKEARKLNRAFFHFIQSGRPLATLKLALTLDGRIATRTGESKWISGNASRRGVQRLRFASDAVLVGINTVLQDDPALDVRWARRKSILKVVLDSALRCPDGARLFESGDPVTIFHGPGSSKDRMAALGRRAALCEVPCGERGLDWNSVLDRLGREGVVSLLVEGGGRTAASLLASGNCSRVEFFYGPLVLGGDGVAGVGPLSLDHLADAIRLERVETRRLGDDFWFAGNVRNS